MGCQNHVILEQDLTFSVVTHAPSTGAAQDADALPEYRVYGGAVAVPILTGTMSLLDNLHTTGLYAATISCTADNGFEIGRSYTVYIRASVDLDEGGISFNFVVEPAMYGEMVAAFAALSDLSMADIAAWAIEGGITLQTFMRVGLSWFAGKTQGANTNDVKFKSQDGLTDRVRMTVDQNGNRSAVVVDGS